MGLALLLAPKPALAEQPAGPPVGQAPGQPAPVQPAQPAPAAGPQYPARFAPPPPTAQPANAAPFGPGTPVQVTTSDKSVNVFVAPWKPYLTDYDFVKIGKTPTAFALPPGKYQLEVQGFGISHAEHELDVRGEPKRLLVRPGSESMGEMGTLLTAVGITAILGGLVVVVGGSTTTPSSIDQKVLYIPLFAAGAALTAGGIGLIVASSTDIEDQTRRVPAASPRPKLSGLALGAGGRF